MNRSVTSSRLSRHPAAVVVTSPQPSPRRLSRRPSPFCLRRRPLTGSGASPASQVSRAHTSFDTRPYIMRMCVSRRGSPWVAFDAPRSPVSTLDEIERSAGAHAAGRRGPTETIVHTHFAARRTTPPAPSSLRCTRLSRRWFDTRVVVWLPTYPARPSRRHATRPHEGLLPQPPGAATPGVVIWLPTRPREGWLSGARPADHCPPSAPASP